LEQRLAMVLPVAHRTLSGVHRILSSAQAEHFPNWPLSGFSGSHSPDCPVCTRPDMSGEPIEQRLLGVCFVAEGPIRRNTFGRLTQSRSYQSEGFRVHFQRRRLKDEMTNRPMIICIMIVDLCKGHECNSPQAASCAYK
jgi:hypothetical protein